MNVSKRLLLSLGLMLVCQVAAAEAKPQLPPLSINAIPVCYNFGCNIRQVIKLTPTEWQGVAGWFSPPPKTPAQERQDIRHAIGWMEVLVGRKTPTHLDAAMDDLLPSDSPGQEDCIDESLNTTTYLHLMENYHLFRFHKVLKRAYRKAILDQHWAGQIEELDNGERFVVDSWFGPNGTLPFVQPTKIWSQIHYFGSANSSTF